MEDVARVAFLVDVIRVFHEVRIVQRSVRGRIKSFVLLFRTRVGLFGTFAQAGLSSEEVFVTVVVDGVVGERMLSFLAAFIVFANGGMAV